jgi:hypothetical protein
LLPFSNILVRHVIFGFEHLSCYQSFPAWLTFRPGLEALLMIGKLVDDPANAKIWLDREVDFKAYRDAFWGKALGSKSLVRSAELRQVLTRLNDEFTLSLSSFIELPVMLMMFVVFVALVLTLFISHHRHR